MFEVYKPILKNKNFIYLWLSQILSQLTINVMNFLLLLSLFKETGSSIATSLLWVSYALPAMLIGPFASAYVDMSDRRRVLKYSNLAQALLIFSYAVYRPSGLFLVYGLAIAYSALNQFYVPAEFATLPDLVKKKHYPVANGLFFLTQQIAVIIGFSLAGPLESLVGFNRALLVCSGLLLMAFLSVTKLPSLGTKEKVPSGIDAAVMVFFKRIAEGYHFIKSRQTLLVSFILLMVLQVCLAIVAVNTPAIAVEILLVPAELGGLLVAVPAGLGALVGALIVSKLLSEKWRKKTTLEVFLATMAFVLVVLLSVFSEMNHTLRLVILLTSIFAVGLSFVGIFIPLQTYLQEVTPGGMRGRVFGNFWFLVTVATIFPVVLSGVITDVFGIRAVLLLLGLLAATGFISIRKFGERYLLTHV